ncbi:hypothetical protein [Deinococcus marmoris]|uniref:PKD repeat n=1 Tax=Deinococcus marmoris TaxID=249408 RepID=A0A1U7P3A8_9DEIO|nr:hypothetical protein [Deinococcus marmoris]OLV19638.1 PKD repeat [Deinococcus marmoris]
MKFVFRLLALAAALLCLAGLASAGNTNYYFLTLSPPTVSVGQTLTATVSQSNGTIDWGDGSASPVTSLAVTHVYAAAGGYGVIWSCEKIIGAGKVQCGAAKLDVTPPPPTLSVTPGAVQTGEKVTATLTNVQPSDFLDWGDGAVVPAAASLTHAYSQSGTFTVRVLDGNRRPYPGAALPVVVSQPIPTLSVTPTAAEVGEKVTATITVPPPDPTSVGAIPLSLDWGDGTVVAAAASLTHAYGKAGAFTVRLLAGGRPIAAMPPVIVTVRAVPDIILKVVPTAAQTGQTVTAILTNLPTSAPTPVQLDWGDGTFVPAAPSQTHAYDRAGTFTVRVVVGDRIPVPSVPPVIVTVTAPLPTPTLSVAPTAVLVNEKVTASLTNFQTSDQLDWGDGSVVSAATSLTHAYGKVGVFTVRLLRNGQPIPAVPPAVITVSVPLPGLSVTPNAVQTGEKVTASLTNFQPGDQLDWGDGTVVAAAASLTHAYSSAGTFTVRLLRGGQPLAGVAPVPVVVSLPTPTLSVTPNAVLVGENVTASLTNVQSADQLDWGDGSVVPVAASLTHSYGSAGTFVVKVLRGGQPIAGVAPAPVVVGLPTPTLTVSPIAVQTGEKVTAILSNFQPGDQLDWADGTVVPAAASLTHSYAKAGAFPVRLLRGGQPLAAVPPVVVTVTAPLPTQTLSVSPSAVLVGEKVTATAGNLQTGDQLDWGDGSVVPAAASLGHSFGKAGTFLVRLLDANARPYPATPPVPVVVSLPNPTLSVSPGAALVGEKITATLTDVQTGDQLDWGDGAVVNAAASLQHVYAQPGTFTVRLLRGGKPAPGVAPVPVVITLPVATLAVSPNAVQTGEKVTATLTNFQTSDQLDWGDGEVVSAAATLTHLYSKAGTFTVRLLRGGQPVAGVAPVPVVVSLPTPALSVTPAAVLVNEKTTATLTNFQNGDQLDWGDGSVVPAASNLAHAYSKAGTFTVRLLRGGQPIAGVAPVPVMVSLPVPTLNVSPASVQTGQPVTATLANIQPGDQLDWGDTAVVPAAASLNHSYSGAGTYLVRLLRGGAPLGSVPPVPVTVTAQPVPCSLEVLTVSPVRWKAVEVKVNGLAAGTAYTLDWNDGTVVSGVSQALTTAGDGSRQNVQQRTYGRAASFVVQVKVGNAPPCIQPITVVAAQIPLAVDPANPAVSQTVTLSVGDVPAGTALKVDWGDGQTQTLNTSGAGDGTFPLGTHVYVKDGTFLIKVSLNQTSELLGTLPVVVTVPMPTLGVEASRAGTPSTVNVGNIQGYPQYIYTLNFGDGTPTQSVTASADIPHIYAVSGVYTVKLTLKADQASERTVVVAAVIDAAVGITGFSTEVRPQAGAAVPAPTPAEVQIGTPTQSVALLNVTGTGTVNLRWTWTPLNVADQPDGQPLTLDTRQVPLNAGANSVPLTLPTAKSGRFLLRVEVLGVTGDSKAVFPGQISLQTVNLTEPGLPKFLVVGEGEDQFRFKILSAPKPISGPLFNPNDFWPVLQVADGSPLMIGLTPVALQQIQAQNLKVKVDGDTAYLVSGSFKGVTQAVKLDTGPVSFVYTEFPAFSPMRLKVRGVIFSPSGAVLDKAVVTSPDFSQSAVLNKLPTYTQERRPGPKRPDEMMQELINQVFDPVFDLALNSVGIPVSRPSAQQRLGLLNTVYAQGKGAGVSDVSAPSAFLQYTQKGQLATSTGTGIGYATEKGRTALQQAASKGVYTGTGVGTLVVNIPPLLATTPKTVEQLQEILGAGQTDFLTFPELYLSNTGDVVSARVVDGKSVASFPSTAVSSQLVTVIGGVLKLGDSGVSMNAYGTQTAYLDLSSKRSVEPNGYVIGQQSGSEPAASVPPVQQSSAGQTIPAQLPAGQINASSNAVPGVSVNGSSNAPLPGLTTSPSQAELLRKTYGGAPSAVQVPDVGPQWQGLLWLSNQVTIDTVAQYDATKGDSEVGADQSMSVELAKKVPVSYGTRGWNLNIDGPDGKVVPGKTRLTGGIPYDAREVVVVMVKTNLIRSLTTGQFGPLPFVGGGKLSGTWDIGNHKVTLDKTGLTRAYGPDGNFTARDVTGSVSQEIRDKNGKIVTKGGVLTFTLLDSTFDLSRVGDGLKLSCSKVIIDGGLVQLPYSTCNSIQGQNRKVAGNPITFNSLSFSSEGKLILAGLSALGNADENGKNITAPARLVLSADALKYTLKLSVDATGQQVSSTPGHETNMTLKGSENDLTGAGLQAIGAGEASAVAHELAFDSGTVGVSDKLSMQVKGLFGHKGNKSYWYLLATGKAADGIPLSIITIYQITGGLAYNMQWGQGQIMFNDLNKRPNDAAGLHLAAGVVVSFTGVDDTTLHAAIVAELSSSPLQLRFGGDGYLLTGGIDTAAGYFGGGKPQARFAGLLNADGLFVDLCVGPANVGNLKCSDLKPLSLAGGVVTVQGAASIELSRTPHVYIGTFRPKDQIGQSYCNPTTSAACAALYRTGRVSVQVNLAIFKSSIDGYVMTGILDGRAPSFVQPGAFGLAAGASIESIYHAGDSGSLLLCDYSWSFDARLFAAVDGAIVVPPNPYIHGHVGLYAGASVSAYGCGIGGTLSASVSLDADFQLGNGSYVDGTAHVQISLPIVPDVDFSTHVHLNL